MKPKGHRTIFNADGETWMTQYPRRSFFYRPAGQPLTARTIQRYVGVLAKSGVDTLCIQAADKKAYYPSKTVPTILDGYSRGDRSFFFGSVLGWEMTPEQIEKYMEGSVHRMDGYLDLVEAGVDWLAETARACRKHRISPWVNVRMNDMHGNPRHQHGYYMNTPLHMNPAMRLRGVSHNPTAPLDESYRGVNYAKREVRDYVMTILRDVVENYDFEGLELDWSRWPVCCEPGAPASLVDLVTEWHAEVRRMTERRARKLGKPYPLGIKFFGTLDQLRSIGLDLREMARRKLIDFVSPTNCWQTSWDIPCDEIRREMGPEVAVYGVVEFAPNILLGYLPHQKKGNPNLGSPMAINYRLSPPCPPILRGNAAGKLALGVDGIEIYNFACCEQAGHWPWPEEPYRAEYPALRGLPDLEFLRGKPKQYMFSSQTGYYTHPLFETPSPFPCMLGAGERRACRLPMCAESDRKLEFVIQVVVRKQDPLPPVGVYLNGCWPNFNSKRDERLLFPVSTMTHHHPDQVGLNFPFPLSAIREGWNEIVVMNGAPKQIGTDQSKETLNILSLECAVRPKARRASRR
jgi:hypothetical protein